MNVPQIHNLDLLAELLASQGHILPDELDTIGRLTPYATVFRYDDLPVASGMDRTEMLDIVQKVHDYVHARITVT